MLTIPSQRPDSFSLKSDSSAAGPGPNPVPVPAAPASNGRASKTAAACPKKGLPTDRKAEKTLPSDPPEVLASDPPNSLRLECIPQNRVGLGGFYNTLSIYPQAVDLLFRPIELEELVPALSAELIYERWVGFAWSRAMGPLSLPSRTIVLGRPRRSGRIWTGVAATCADLKVVVKLGAVTRFTGHEFHDPLREVIKELYVYDQLRRAGLEGVVAPRHHGLYTALGGPIEDGYGKGFMAAVLEDAGVPTAIRRHSNLPLRWAFSGAQT